MTFAGGPPRGAVDSDVMTGVCRQVLGHVGVNGEGAERIVDQLLAARGAATAGTYSLKFTAHAGELEIVLSQAGRDWRTSCPVPIR